MAINPPRIAGVTTVQRKFIIEQPVSLSYDLPSGTPDYEGQLHVRIKVVNFFFREGEMYVGTDVEGTLTWLRGDVSTYVNGYTGRAWDPYEPF